jgi:prepilin signal peptidase PulO-like enzyme (type II secretory pathway)
MTVKILVALFITIFGWFGAAIINYVADVLPVYRKLGHPICTHCNAIYRFSRYLRLSVCGACGTSLSLRHKIVAFSVPIACGLEALRVADQPLVLVQNIAIILFFSLVIVIDIEHHLILHIVSLLGAFLFIWIGFTQHGWLATLEGGTVGLAVMLLLYFIGLQFSKALSKKRGEEVEEGLGFGDVILAFVCGLLLGWPGISIGLFSGIMLGGIYSLGVIVISTIKKKYEPFMAIPYGPFIAAAAMLLWFFA